MKIALVQMHSILGDIPHNMNKGRDFYLEAAESGANIVVFPELWSCGYALNEDGFIEAAGKSREILEEFKTWCKKYGTLALVPLPVYDRGKLYIDVFLVEKNGQIIHEYKKSNLWGNEQKMFVPGPKKYEPVQTSIGRIGVLICYDLEFPEPARILALKGAELILGPSVWSDFAKNRWNLQLPARALDNTVFIAGVNQVNDGACGLSKVVSPLGEVLAEASPEKEEVLLCDVDFSELARVRSFIPYLREFDMCLYPGGL